MKRKDKVEIQRQRIAKAVRNAIRLRYSMLADEEINDVLPGIIADFDDAVSAGKPFVLDVKSVFDGVK